MLEDGRKWGLDFFSLYQAATAATMPLNKQVQNVTSYFSFLCLRAGCGSAGPGWVGFQVGELAPAC